MEGEAGGGAKRVLRVVRILLFPAIVTAVFVGMLPRIADLDRVWAAIGSLTSAQYLVLALLASRVGRAAGRQGARGWGELAVRFPAQTIQLVRARWVPLLAAEVVSQLSVFVVFLASARFLGISNTEASWAQVLAVFAFVRLA